MKRFNFWKFALIVVFALGGMFRFAPTQRARAATIIVNSTADNLTAGDGNCTLREAIRNANLVAGGDSTSGDCVTANAGTDTITFASALDNNPIQITIVGSGEADAATGDLDITDTLTITGNGSSKTIIQANFSSDPDRVFQFISGTVTINDLTIEGGSRPSGTDVGTAGAGILNGTTAILNRVRVTDNHSGYRGGGIHNGVFGTGSMIINDSTVDANTSMTSGGGIFSEANTVVINNSTISGNQAQGSSGGVGAIGGSITLNHVTVAGNMADSDNLGGGEGGGGIAGLAPGTIYIQNSLIADNTVGSSGSGTDCRGTITSQSYNLIENNCGITLGTGDITGIDPALDPTLAPNGGPTPNHAITSSSPAANIIPSGTNGCGITYITDQRGYPRPFAAKCDSGAFEVAYVISSSTNGGDGPGGVGATDGTTSLEGWYRADRGVLTDPACSPASPALNGNNVQCWLDQSGNSNNAIQGTGGVQPVYATNALNGQPLLQFDGVDDVLNLPDGTVPSGNSPYSVFALVNAETLGVRGFLGSGNYTATGDSNAFRFNTDGALINYWWADDLITDLGTVSAVTNYALSFVYNTSTGRTAWVNGVIPTNGTDPSVARNSSIANNTIGGTNSTEFWNGTIADIIIFSSTLPETERILVENYLSAKYDVPLSTNDVYNGDDNLNNDFDLDVAGIGQSGGGIQHTQANAAGMIVLNNTFLKNDGDWLLFGHRTPVNGNNTTTYLPTAAPWDTAPNPVRWERYYYIDVTDAGTNGGKVDIIFDFSEGGMGGPNPTGPVSNYRLLKRSGINVDFADITVASGANVVINGDQVQFIGVDVSQLGSNFTLGSLDGVNSPTALTLQTLTVRSTTLPIAIAALALLSGTLLLLLWRKKNHFPHA